MHAARLPVVLLGLLGLADASAADSHVPTHAAAYRGHQVLRIPVRADNAAAVHGAVDALGLEVWQTTQAGGVGSSGYADVVVPSAAHGAALAARLGAGTMAAATTMHADLAAAVAREAAESEARARRAVDGVGGVGGVDGADVDDVDAWFDAYHAYADHVQFLEDLHAKHPTRTELVTAGQSHEGRNITGIRVLGTNDDSDGGPPAKARPVVVVHGTVHAREWIATLAVEYMAAQLLNASARVAAAAAAYDVELFPVVNPDGFVFSQTDDRFWRKNRQPTTGRECVGRDINRNWPIAWDGTEPESESGRGSESTEKAQDTTNTPRRARRAAASLDPCAADFRGAAAGDAPETQALAAWLRTAHARGGLQLLLDVHAYGQLLMTPYAYSCTRQPPGAAAARRLVADAAAAVGAVHGSLFGSGGVCERLYRATGSGIDYARDVVGAAYSVAAELRDRGDAGFLLPAAQIRPACEETLTGVAHLLETMPRIGSA